MKKSVVVLGAAVIASVLTVTTAFAKTKKKETWTVTCPYAPSGVAAMVTQKMASLSTSYSDDIILVAQAIKGDNVTVNNWIAQTKANDKELVSIGEGLLAITPILDPAKVKFSYDDFVFIQSHYSSVFVMSAQAKLGIKNINDLKAYMQNHNEVTVATNGAVGSEAFLAAALFGSSGFGDKMKLIAYKSAAEAAQAVSRGETNFAVSHQSQILEAYQQKGVTIVCAFDADDIKQGPFKGVEGVGKYGYPYFRNRSLICARKGTDPDKIKELKALYNRILEDKGVNDWLTNTMLLDMNKMTEQDVLDHIRNVRNIVNRYKSVVVKK